MSNEGRLGREGAAALADVLDPRRLLRHRHSAPEFIDQYRDLAARAAAKKLPGVRALAPHLTDFITNEKTLFTALGHMRAEGSAAPGPDGLRYEDIAAVGDWKWCRAVRDDIRSGDYAPGPERVVRIPKGSGRGFRELVVQSVEDRVVQRAAVEVLQPLLDPLFDPRSFGYRPKKGPLRALATAEALSGARGFGAWVSADIRGAFPSVPVGRLLGVVRKYLPDDGLIDFVETLTRPDATPGLRQGSPLSPLLLNLYLHHVLDRPWRRASPGVPLLRFADDIVLLCRTPGEAGDAYDALAELLRPAGFALKESKHGAVRHLSGGETVNWMGFGVGASPGGLTYSVTDAAWDGLAEGLAGAHGRPNSPLAAAASLCGWVGGRGPCFPHTDHPRAYRRVRAAGAAQGFDELPDRREVAALWQRAYARWCRLRAKVAAGESGFPEGIKS